MTVLLSLLLLAAVGACIYLAMIRRKEQTRTRQIEMESSQKLEMAETRRRDLEAELEKARAQIARLARWENVADAVEKARRLLASAEAKLAQAQSDASNIAEEARHKADAMLQAARDEGAKATSEARTNAKRLAEKAQAALAGASARSAQIIADANRRAEEIAGQAYDVLRNAELYERTAKAMKNIIEGYGDEYLKPAASLLDELAEELGHKEAGQQLKLARDHTKALIKSGQAARCEYVESSRREGAENFVLDAFNGKTDSILSRVRHDNYGKLEQEMRGAFTIVNYGGKAFREARITEEFWQRG